MLVQYAETDINCQNNLTDGSIGKWSPHLKEALWFVPLIRMESSSVDGYTICKLHLINTWEPCKSDLLSGAINYLNVQIDSDGKVVSRLVYNL